MAAEVKTGNEGIYLEIHLSEKLTQDDYHHFIPIIEERIKDQGQVRILVILHDFHGWTTGAMWEDMKFDLRHFGDINRLAVVGESKWEQGMTVFCTPFTTAKIRFFDESKLQEATTWIQEQS
ncbi:MAG TPA: STAS/SEC14 domain-containing protein [Planctomicrobium sp.]|nr:STAS/SEC14 domain-containing protein [Planctomicrobium sp.]